MVVYRVTEPAIDPDIWRLHAVLRDIERFPLTYPDAQVRDRAGQGTQRGSCSWSRRRRPIVVTKALGGARVYRARAPLSPSGTALELITVSLRAVTARG